MISSFNVVLLKNAYHRFIDWHVVKQQRENDCLSNDATDVKSGSLQG